MRRTSTVALALGCWWLTGARAQETESPPPPAGPDLEFLEYLGSWAEEDDEWLAIEQLREDNAENADKDPEEQVESESGDAHESD
jgi:hypothetical protein